jgi:hypothetical protein
LCGSINVRLLVLFLGILTNRHKTLWPEEPQINEILNIRVLTGEVNIWDAKGIIDIGPDKGQRVDLETGIIITGPQPSFQRIADFGDLGRQRRRLIAG